MRCLRTLLVALPLLAVGATAVSAFTPGDFELEGELGSFESTLSVTSPEQDVWLLDLRLRAPRPSTPPEVTLRWRLPSVDVYGFWNPQIGIDKVNYYSNRLESRATVHAPVVALLSPDDENRFTFAASDALRKLDLGCRIKEEDAHFHCWIRFFGEPSPPTDDYRVVIRLDRRGVRYEDALADVTSWWAAQPGYEPTPVPALAREPMYSTWYNFHQNLDTDLLLRELEIARDLGYRAVIVDDGWQTLDSSRGYAYTGDWQPLRIPDMGEFVDRVHELDMGFLLWYSLPFVGENADSFSRFEGKFLKYWDGQGTWVLDPRYPEVREAIISTYEQALGDWRLDGFKLDFIDRFRPTEETEFTATDGRDMASLDAAVDRLMTDVLARLRKIRPDIAVEFRQRYVGPLMRKYGNMFRAVDCPNNAIANRAETLDLRLLSGDTAVHSDMVMWHRDEPVERAALQLLNILFSVPQLSVLVTELPPEHLEMIGFWTNFWSQRREVLLDGELRAHRPAALYPLVEASTADHRVVAVYEDFVVPVKGALQETLEVVNAKASGELVLDLESTLR